MRVSKYFTSLIYFFSAIVITDASTSFSCTTITVGKKASADGSVITSHTCDSRKSRTWFDIVPHQVYESEAKCAIYRGRNYARSAAALDTVKVIDEIPQIKETYAYVNTAYPCMNEHQLAIGESTFGGRKELRNPDAMFHCSELCRLVVERTKTARAAIRLIDELTKKYGYNDGGECLTIADTKEVWHFEILGCGKDRIGAVWAAQRIPDDHIGVDANASRIRQINLNDPDHFMASDNVFSLAEEMGYWEPKNGQPFEFCYAYNPKGRRSMAARRREWRVFDLLAPSSKLDPNAENYPFSVKPDKPVTVQQLMEIFRDTFEGTEFDMTKFMIVEDDSGRAIKSPYANPFMHYDMMPLFKVNGGWGKMGERCIARYYCTYVFISQSRDWLPDPIGGLLWLGWDNPAMTSYAPIYCGITDVPESYKVCGRPGFNRDCAWWAFNRVADLAAQKWGHMRVDVDSVRKPIEEQAFANQESLEKKAVELYNKDPHNAKEFLTNHCTKFCKQIVESYWDLGDHLWSKYTGVF